MQKSAMVWVPLVAMKKLQPRRRQLGRTTSEVSVAALKEQGRRLAVMLTKDNSANFWVRHVSVSSSLLSSSQFKSALIGS
jgi:hypothetical protein